MRFLTTIVLVCGSALAQNAKDDDYRRQQLVEKQLIEMVMRQREHQTNQKFSPSPKVESHDDLLLEAAKLYVAAKEENENLKEENKRLKWWRLIGIGASVTLAALVAIVFGILWKIGNNNLYSK